MRCLCCVMVVALWLTACTPGIPSQASPSQATPTIPVSAVPAPAPQPAPTATLAPEEAFNRGLERRAAGDYDSAAEDFFAASNTVPEGPVARVARYYLAESFALRGRWTSAVEALNAFVADNIQDEWSARALFLIARGHEEAGSHAAAITAYERYRALATPAEPYARLRQAAQERALGRLDAAASGYEAVAASAIARGERAAAYERAIALRRELGQQAQALQLARDLLALAEQPDYRARMLFELAALPRDQGDIATARAWLTEAIERAPASPAALAALEQLRADPGAQVPPELAAGTYEAHGRWPEAIAALDIAIGTASGNRRADLLRRHALALRATGDFAGALAGLDAAIVAGGDSDAGRQAQLDRIQTVGQSGATEAAIAEYRAFAAGLPDDPRAPEALQRAALLLDRLGDSDGAAEQRIDLGRRYPASPLAQEAFFSGAMYLFTAGRAAEALVAWQELATASSGATAIRARYWAGRAALAAGETATGRARLEEVIATAPDSYFAARARVLLGLQESGTLPPASSLSDADWRAIAEWLTGWAGAPPANASDPASDPAVQRALELNALGLRGEAMAEWSAVLSRHTGDPHALATLAHLAHEHDMPAAALRAAGVLARLAPGDDQAVAPAALRRLIYPTPFTAAVLARAREFGIDPALLFALLRQESAFNPAATSWAGARGLAQVMPATGQGIARALGMPGFQEHDLYRPELSIRFGAYYLSRQLAAMDGNVEGALAAYNGGPGNAQRWSGGAPIADPDLFAERIDFEETRNYVKAVIGQYDIYRRLYTWK